MTGDDGVVGGHGPTRRIQVTVNGTPRDAEVEPRTLLVYFLREQLGLTGTHIGCDTSNCGACTVQLDGRPVKSCTVFAVQADGRRIRTVEGLEQEGVLSPLQAALAEAHGLQCGFCTPGMLMTATALVEGERAPGTDAIREALRGNLCRCTGYANIVQAVEAALRGHRPASEPKQSPASLPGR